MKPKQCTITEADARRLGTKLRIDYRRTPFEWWWRGMQVECEHWRTVRASKIAVARIARDHIREYPDYYQRLARMERAAERYWSRKQK